MTLSPKVRAQAARFGRLFGIALATQVAALQGAHLTRSVIVAVVVGAAETAFRQLVAPPAPPAAPGEHEAPAQ